MSYFKQGDWNAICDVCGFEFKASELRKRWDGLRVCRKDWEPRHPQDLIRSKRESTIPWSRPEGPDQFTAGAFLTDENNLPILDERDQNILVEEFTNGAEFL